MNYNPYYYLESYIDDDLYKTCPTYSLLYYKQKLEVSQDETITSPLQSLLYHSAALSCMYYNMPRLYPLIIGFNYFSKIPSIIKAFEVNNNIMYNFYDWAGNAIGCIGSMLCFTKLLVDPYADLWLIVNSLHSFMQDCQIYLVTDAEITCINEELQSRGYEITPQIQTYN